MLSSFQPLGILPHFLRSRATLGSSSISTRSPRRSSAEDPSAWSGALAFREKTIAKLKAKQASRSSAEDPRVTAAVLAERQRAIARLKAQQASAAAAQIAQRKLFDQVAGRVR